MLASFKRIGSLIKSLHGWWLFLMSTLPVAVTFISGFYEKLPWAHTIALTVLALAGGAVLAVCLISIWEKMGGRKQAALLALGEVWEDGTTFRNEASRRPPPLTQDDLDKILDFEVVILENVGIVSKVALSKFRKINTYWEGNHPRDVHPRYRGGDKKLIVFSERLRRVGEFIDKYSD